MDEIHGENDFYDAGYEEGYENGKKDGYREALDEMAAEIEYLKREN